MYVYLMHACGHRGQKKVSGVTGGCEPSDLVLGTKRRSSAAAVCSLNCCAISAASVLNFNSLSYVYMGVWAACMYTMYDLYPLRPDKGTICSGTGVLGAYEL